MRRAFPSRDMVAGLVPTLDLPLRQHNELLGAASSVWHETKLASPERVRDALDYMMAQQQS